MFQFGPSVVAWGPDRLDLFGLGTKWDMFHKAWNGSDWAPKTGWDHLDGTFKIASGGIPID